MPTTTSPTVAGKKTAKGGDGSTCLVETTVAGVNPVKHTGAQTRANISTAITDKFSSIGYRGTTAAGISTTPWFHNKETNADGTLVEDIRWAWAQPYGRFYGISPQVTTAYNKLTVSDVPRPTSSSAMPSPPCASRWVPTSLGTRPSTRWRS